MGSYILNFIVYSMAMCGLIFFALFVYKKVMSGGFCARGHKTLEVEEVMNVNPRKSFMIVRAGTERFLVASDVDRTSLISKLDSEIPIERSSKSLDRFQEIQNLYNQDRQFEPQNLGNIEGKEEVINDKEDDKTVHFEVITHRNPHQRSRRASNVKNSYISRNYSQGGNRIDLNRNRRVSDVDASNTMKAMANKINNL